MPRFCSNCGNPLPDIGKFCPKCGQPIADDPVPQPEAPSGQPEQFQNQYSYQFNPPQPQNQNWHQPQSQHWEQAQGQNWQPSAAVSQPAETKKKSKAGLIIGLIALLLAALAAVACFVWPGFLKKDDSAPSETLSSSTAPVTEPTPTASKETAALTTAPTTEPQPTVPATTEAPTAEPTTTEPPVTEPVNPFLDVIEDDPCYEEYLWAHAHGVVEGELLEGDRILTRAETLSMLWNAFDRPAAAQNDMPFGDVYASADYYSAVLWAVHAHLVSVPEDGAFKPNDEMTRDQAATILCSAVGGDGTGKPKAYLDVGSKKYYYNAVNWGCAAGVLERYYDFSFRPSDPLLRADFACWLARAMEPELALDPAIPEGDDFDYYGVEVNLHPHGVAYFNAQTKEDQSITKKLKVTSESYESFQQADGFEAKSGYEWKKGVFLIDFGEADANSYSYHLRATVCDSYYADLFEANRSYNEDDSEYSWVIFNGEPWKIYVSHLETERIEGALFRVSYVVQVPVGYDGLVVRISDAENGSTNYYESFDPANFVIFRFE